MIAILFSPLGDHDCKRNWSLLWKWLQPYLVPIIKSLQLYVVHPDIAAPSGNF